MCEFENRYNKKYRISSTRLKNWDYSRPAMYFVTICTEGGYPWFGKIIGGKINLSAVGEIVAIDWKHINEIRKNITLKDWIIMPNHIHGIIIIETKINFETSRWDVSTNYDKIKFRLKPNSLGSIIGQFKSNCTKKIRFSGYTDFKWQSRFYDHIIRNKKEFYQIRNYIRYNPIRWENKHLL